ncbi:MAG: hypothetical protein LAP38_28055 [Acidobacteriia bacterium]|nr:hypothetical protein [Terriglobia bacterium]
MTKRLLVTTLAVQLALFAAPAEKKLAIVAVAFAQFDDGPPTAHDEQFVPGETLFFRCQVEGYKKSDKDEVHLTYQVEAADASGVALRETESGKVEATLSQEDKNWMPKIRYTVVVPPLAESGQYHVLVKVKDELSGTAVEERATFLVTGRDVAPSDTLAVRNFRFFRGENDAAPLQVAAYRPGDALWARFDMTGYKIGEKNLFDIEYGLVVLRADGSTAYSQPEAATAKEAPFYPQRYQPGELNLNMPKDIATGVYTIVLTVRDNLGNQTAETREKFSIE